MSQGQPWLSPQPLLKLNTWAKTVWVSRASAIARVGNQGKRSHVPGVKASVTRLFCERSVRTNILGWFFAVQGRTSLVQGQQTKSVKESALR